MVARIGGDEFALLLLEAVHARQRGPGSRSTSADEMRTPSTSQRAAARGTGPASVLRRIPITTCRSGPDEGRGHCALSAKDLGRNRVCLQPQMRGRDGTANGNRVGSIRAGPRPVRLFYHPRSVSGQTGSWVLEALARWQHPEKGLLTPGYSGRPLSMRNSRIHRESCLKRWWRRRGVGRTRPRVRPSSGKLCSRSQFAKPALPKLFKQCSTAWGAARQP
jgi:hypothetical protein